MYNRILKRPMFKRGGSSFQAQGTGITSPYDTPRKNYKIGTTWEEINERRSGLYRPRSDMSFATEGFSELGNPYKESGEAKMISEMLHAGAGQVRKSRAADDAMRQSVDLANIESDAARLMAEEKHARDLEIVDRSAKSQLNKDYSIKRQVLDLTKQLNKQAENAAFEGSEFINDGFGQAVAQGIVEINENGYHAMAVPFSAIKKVNGVWDIDLATLAPGMVYWNPVNQQWLIVENARTKDAKEIPYGSYHEAKAGLKALETGDQQTNNDPFAGDASESEKKSETIKLKITTNLKGVDITDESVIFDEAAKIGLKIVSPDGTKTWAQNLAENEISLPAFKKLLAQKKMADTYAGIKKKPRGQLLQQTEDIRVTEKKAIGGRAGYAGGSIEPDPDADEMNELTSWWKSEVANSFNS